MKRIRLSPGARFLGIALIWLGAQAQGAIRPYCTGGSSSGYTWWNWTNTSQDAACGVVLKKILSAGHAVNHAYWGTYDTNRSNMTATLVCTQGQRSVIGSGADIFTNALNMRSQLGWGGCVLKVH